MPRYKFHFQHDWLQDEKYSSWLQKDDSAEKARCKICSESFSVTSLGLTTLKVYASGKKHSDRVPKKDVISFLQLGTTAESESTPEKRQVAILDMLLKDDSKPS